MPVASSEGTTAAAPTGGASPLTPLHARAPTAWQGDEGHTFLKLDSGMTELLRPSLYGAQHPVILVPAEGEVSGGQHQYIAVGHCCESGDLVTPAPDEPEVRAVGKRDGRNGSAGRARGARRRHA